MNYPNGRVNILDNAPNSVFNLYDKIPVEQNITSYRNALTGNLEDNMLSKVFFSKGNIIILQRKIIKGVFDNSNGRFQIRLSGRRYIKNYYEKYFFTKFSK